VSIKIPQIPLKLPSHLLERRPDIAAAERRVAAANAQIGMAIAGFFPTITLSANPGYTNNSVSQLITKPNQYWSLGTQLKQLLFDSGKQKAITQAAKENFEQSVANYKQTVLTAFQNVEDSLSSIRLLQIEANAQQNIVNEAIQTLQITTNRYQAGTIAYAEVINTQIVVFNAKLAAIAIKNKQITAAVGLILALGGDWTTEINHIKPIH
jgi:NodT family efflux transporter outer membrane factor (OMF) lipoprotein